MSSACIALRSTTSTATAHELDRRYAMKGQLDASKDCWDEALKNGEKYGYRNAQVTVLAPTGTIRHH